MKRLSSWRWQRIAIKATALLLLGMFSTALTAAVAAYLPGDREHAEFGWASRSISFGATRYSAETGLAKRPDELGKFMAIVEELQSTRLKAQSPPRDPSRHLSHAPSPDWCFIRGERWGVPLRAFEGWRGVRPNGQTIVVGDLTQLFVNDRGLALVMNGHRIVPIVPLYAGFAINSLIYSTVWLAVILAIGHLRRSLRRRRGLCPACAYDIRATPTGSPCPECGQAAPIR